MFARKPFAKVARRLGLFVERLEDRVNPVRSVSPTEVLATLIDVQPVNAAAPPPSAFDRLGISADRVTPLGYGLVRVATNGADPEALVARLRATPGIASAQPNYVYEAGVEYTPNDNKYSLQTNLPVMHVPQAWDVLINAGKPLGNSGTVVAVLDEGISITASTATPSHNDLQDGPGSSTGIAFNYGELNNTADDDGNGFLNDYAGWDFIENDNDPSPASGANHGLEVAGIIAARINNANAIGTASRIAGFAGGVYDENADNGNGDNLGGVRILPIRVINGSTITSAGLAAGLNYTASRFVRIANLSFDLDGFAADSAVQTAMTNLYDSGCLIVASAGNTGTKDAARGAFDQVLFVAGTSNADKLSQIAVNGVYSSNYGSYVDISAPSENVISLSGTTGFTTPGAPNTYGTSLAAPAVAGTAALLLAQNASYTRDQLAAKLLGTAVNIDTLNPGYEGQLGAGRVDALAALTQPLAAPTITDIKINGVSVQDGATVNGISTITLSVKGVLNPASVTANAFELRGDGPDNVFGNGDDVVVPLTLFDAYRVGDTTITLTAPSFLASDHYRFTAKSGVSALRDAFNTPFNGGVTLTKDLDIAAPSFLSGDQTASSTSGSVDVSRVATLNNGNSVVTWGVSGYDGAGFGVMARIYDPDGRPLTGEFLVNITTSGDQLAPEVCSMADGGFVIAWSDVNGNNNTSSIRTRRYDSSSKPVTGEVTVYSMSYYAPFALSTGDITPVGAGYAVAYYRSQNPGTLYPRSSYFNYVDAANQVGSIVNVTPSVPFESQIRCVSGDSAGNIWVAYYNENSNADAYIRKYSTAGVALTPEILVSNILGVVQYPFAMARGASGAFVVTYQQRVNASSNHDVYAAAFDSTGVAIGPPLVINDVQVGNQEYSTIVGDGAGNYLMAWDSAGGTGIYARRFSMKNSSLVAEGGSFLLSSDQVSVKRFAELSTASNGDISATWSTSNSVSFSRSVRFSRLADLRPGNDNNLTTSGERVVQSITSLVAGFTTPLLATAINASNWQLTIDGLDKSAQISSINYNSTPNSNGLYEVTLNLSQPILTGNVTLRAKDTIQDLNGNALDGDANGTFGGDFVRSFTVANISPQGAVGTLNTTAPAAGSTMSNPKAAVLPDGRFISVREGEGPGDSKAIVARFLSKTGVPTGAEILVNDADTQYQRYPAVAVLADGSFAVTWTEDNGATADVYVRRFNSAGAAITGEVVVNSITGVSNQFSNIAASAAGGFTIAWAGQPMGGGSTDIHAQRYSAAGVAGTDFVVNNYTNLGQSFPDVAMDAAGNTVFVWKDDAQDGNGTTGVYGRLMRADGTFQGTDFRVATNAAGDQHSPGVAMTATGDFGVVWNTGDQNMQTMEAWGRLFNAAGVPLTGDITLATATTNNQQYPHIAVDADGDYSTVWVSNDKAATYDFVLQRFNAAGNKVGTEQRISNANTHQNASVALDATGSGVLLWTEFPPVAGTTVGTFVQRLGANDALTTTGLANLTLGEDSFGNVSLAGKFNDPNNPSPSFTYSIVGNTNPSLFSGMSIVGNTVFTYPGANASGSSVITVRATIAGGLYVDASFAVIVQPVNDPPTFVKGSDLTTVINSVPQTFANWATAISGGPGEADAVSFEIVSNSNPGLFSTAPAVSGTGTLTYATNSAEYGAAVIQVRAKDNGGTANGGIDASATQTFVITVDPTNPANRVLGATTFANADYAAGTQTVPAVAANNSGARVVVWAGEGAGDTSGVFGQLYASNGSRVGANFRVNAATDGAQQFPSVVMAGDGSFAVTWQGNDSVTFNNNVFVRFFNAYGVPVTGDIAVNKTTDDFQGKPKIAMAGDSHIAIAWHSGPVAGPGNGGAGQDGSDYGVYFALLNADGTFITATDQRANTTTTGGQYNPAVAMGADGSFAIAWEAKNEGGGNVGQDLRFQRFTAAGAKVGGEVVPHVVTTSAQTNPAIAADADGDLVLAWASTQTDGFDANIYARRFTAGGAAVEATEFLVNSSYTTGIQTSQTVAMDADGDFAVSWSGEGAGDSSGVYFQRYARSGTATGAATRVNAYTAGSQFGWGSAMDADGDTYFVWNGEGSEDTFGIYYRRFGIPEPTGVSTPPIVNDADGLIDLGTLFNNNSGPQEALSYSLGTAIVNTASLAKKSLAGRVLTVEFEPGINGSAEIPIRAADTTEGLNGAGVIIVRKLQDANASPILDFIRNRSLVEGGTLSLTATATDRQGAANLAYSLQKTNPGGTAINSASGALTWTSSDNGSFDITVRVTDPDNTYFTQETFTVTVANANPTATIGGPSVAAPNAPQTFSFTNANDVAADKSSLRYAWDYNNDGTWDAGGATYATALASASTVAPGTFFSTAGTTRIVRGRVIDKDNGFTDYFLSVNVENVGGSLSVPTATIAVNGGGAQRSNVRSLVVTFDQAVSFPQGLANAFTLSRTGAGSPTGIVPTTATLNGSVLTVTFDAGAFTSTTVAEPSLIDGTYVFTLLGANVQGLAGPLNGGGNQSLTFKRAFGDANGDATVDASDLSFFGNTFGSSLNSINYSSAFDSNLDGTIDASDLADFGNRFGRTF